MKSTQRTVAVASDHAGFALKQRVLEALRRRADVVVVDLGPPDESRVDYPDYARRVAQAIARGDAALGVLVCGSGIGMSMAANRVPGVRAALVHDDYTARMARAHNDAQILCLGSRVIGEDVALSALETFLVTPFEGGRHAGRVARIDAEGAE